MLLPPGGLLLLTFYIIHSAGAFDSEFKTSQPGYKQNKDSGCIALSAQRVFAFVFVYSLNSVGL